MLRRENGYVPRRLESSNGNFEIPDSFDFRDTDFVHEPTERGIAWREACGFAHPKGGFALDSRSMNLEDEGIVRAFVKILGPDCSDRHKFAAPFVSFTHFTYDAFELLSLKGLCVLALIQS